MMFFLYVCKHLIQDMDSLRKIEEDLSYIDDSNMIPPADIVAFNELRSCADLFRMYDKKQLEIQPDFQRNVVWKASAQTRFIDSLIKQLPIPSICISLDYKTEKRIIIDGLQRISSIIKFLADDTWRLSRISDIDCNLSGKTVSEIKQNNWKHDGEIIYRNIVGDCSHTGVDIFSIYRPKSL